MNATVQLRARIPEMRLKKVQKTLELMGVDATGVINMLFAQIELQGRLPFEVVSYAKPNVETLAAIAEAESGVLEKHKTKKEFFAALRSK